MKLLFVFIDMLRPGLLNLVNSSYPESPLDTELKKWGGVIYTKCYTPAPDTPRSHGCFWSSNYPKFNGCDTRAKYPRYYLSENVPNLLQILRDNGYSLNVFESSLQNVTSTEFLPAKIPYSPPPPHTPRYTNPDIYSHGKNLSEYLRDLVISDNSLTLLQFIDFHLVVNNCLDITKHVRQQGLKLSGDILSCIRTNLHIDDFDFTVFYSDHGFISADQRDGLTSSALANPQLLLSDSRTQVMMHVRRKGDTTLSRNDKLSSIMDVLPTVLNFCRIPYDNSSIEGHDLLSSEAHDILLAEDYSRLEATGGEVNIWSARTEKGLACVDSMMNWTANYSITEDEKEKFASLLSEKGSCFAIQSKAASIKKLNTNTGSRPLLLYDGSLSKKLMIKRLRDFIMSLSETMSKLMRRTAKVLLR